MIWTTYPLVNRTVKEVNGHPTSVVTVFKNGNRMISLASHNDEGRLPNLTSTDIVLLVGEDPDNSEDVTFGILEQAESGEFAATIENFDRAWAWLMGG